MKQFAVLFLMPFISYGQSASHDYKKLTYDLNTKNPEYKIGRNNFAGGLSGVIGGNAGDGALALFFMGGFEKTFGQPEKEGYFFSGEIRARAGALMDIGEGKIQVP